MKAIILLVFYLFSLSLGSPENQDNIQKALLINTNLTKEELTQLLNTEGSNTEIEEVSPDAESETESETEKIFKNLRNGKLKIKVKLELNLKDLKGKKKGHTETEKEGESEDGTVVKTAFIQTPVPQVPQKVSLFKYILALLIMVILMSLFVLSSTTKEGRKRIIYQAKKNDDYLLQDN